MNQEQTGRGKLETRASTKSSETRLQENIPNILALFMPSKKVEERLEHAFATAPAHKPVDSLK